MNLIKRVNVLKMLHVLFQCLEHVTRVTNEYTEHKLLTCISVFSYDNKAVDFCQVNKISGLIDVKHAVRSGLEKLLLILRLQFVGHW